MTAWAITTSKDLYPNPIRSPHPTPRAYAFVPPPVPITFSFCGPDLFQSIARCTALKRSTPGLTAALLIGCEPLLRHLVEDSTNVFAITDEVKDLADAERTAFAGRVGVGMADLFMSSISDASGRVFYTWRDVAEQFIKKPSRGGLGDFIYEAATGEQVLVEAKGMIRSTASRNAANRLAEKAYNNQVKPYIDQTPAGARGGTFGPIEHGYAIAFAALPGSTSPPTGDAFMSVVEPPLPLPGSPAAQPGGAGPVTTPLRLGNYRAVFLLSNAKAVVEQIDARLNDLEPPGEAVQLFWIVRCDEIEFLIGRDPFYPEIAMIPGRCDNWIFAINRKSAEIFLGALSTKSGAPPSLPQSLLVPRIPFASARSSVQSADGFAMLHASGIRLIAEAEWHSKSGELKAGSDLSGRLWTNRSHVLPKGTQSTALYQAERLHYRLNTKGPLSL